MFDLRALKTEKIIPPEPLPYVSRKALARVKDRMAPPTECPYCKGAVTLAINAEVYGREYGDWPYLYLCKPCNAYVGLHPDTDLPLGTMATRPLREARKSGKAAFFAMAKQFNEKRNDAYRWLAGVMGIPLSRCHWGWFDVDQCEKAKACCSYRMRKVDHE